MTYFKLFKKNIIVFLKKKKNNHYLLQESSISLFAKKTFSKCKRHLKDSQNHSHHFIFGLIAFLAT